MDKKELYNSWVEKKRRVEIDRSFSDKVMNKIYQYEERPKWYLLRFDMQRLVDVISSRMVIKDSLVIAGALIGFARIIFMLFMILGKGVING